MELEGFGIRLRPLQGDDLERVRMDPQARERVAWSEWERSIHEDRHCAWLGLWQERPIGLARVRLDERSGRSGSRDAVLWSGGRDGMGPVRMAILVIDWCFGALGLEELTGSADGDPCAARLDHTLGYASPFSPGGNASGEPRLTPEAWSRRRPELVEEASRLERYGIELRRLRADDLEMVRRWRNDPEIRQYMRFRRFITKQEQRRWFESIDNERNHYSLVLWRGTPIGLSHVKDCDYERGTGEGGLFIWARQFRDSTFALRVAIAGTDWCFDDLGLETVTGTVLKDNRRAIRFNQSLGHVFDPEEPGVETLRCRLTRGAYARARPALVRVIT